jgi:2-polyprenyl-3-methyl-5-hydroxy-6-metoxy-1,4-benzoquinol methylase
MPPLTLQDEKGFNQIFSDVGSSRVRKKRRNDWFLGEIITSGAQRVLEIGCGTGETAAYMAQHSQAEIVAIDISEQFIAAAREQHTYSNLRFECLNLLDPHLVSRGQFDVIYGNGILHHLVLQLPAFLTVLKQTTRPGGRMAFVEPNLLNPYCAFLFGTKFGRKFGRLEPDEMAFTPWKLRAEFERAKWSDIKVETRDFLLPGLPEALIRPSLLIEPLLEATVLTRWLAQSHFVTARA